MIDPIDLSPVQEMAADFRSLTLSHCGYWSSGGNVKGFRWTLSDRGRQYIEEHAK